MEGKICQVYDLMKANLNLDMGNHENEALLWQIESNYSSTQNFVFNGQISIKLPKNDNIKELKQNLQSEIEKKTLFHYNSSARMLS